MKNKVIWITGASSGIGEAVAIEFVSRGAKLILSARRVEELQRVKNQCVSAGAVDADVLVLPMDVCDDASMDGAVQQALNTFQHIDLLFNNAGISQRSFCENTDMAVYRKLFDVDVFGQIAMTKKILPHMLTRGDGHIAITASVAGKIGVAKRTGYCAAKHAVMGFYDALRAEVEHRGVRVSTVVPGFIRTNISNQAITGDGSTYGEMDEDIASGMDVNAAAQVIVAGLEKNKKEINVGKGFEMVALRLKRFVPGFVLGMMSKRGQDEYKKQQATNNA